MKNTAKIMLTIVLAAGLLAVLAAPAAAGPVKDYADSSVIQSPHTQSMTIIDNQNIPEEEQTFPDGGGEEMVPGDENENVPDDTDTPDETIDQDEPEGTVPQTPPQTPPVTTGTSSLPNTGTQLLIFAGAGIVAFLAALAARRHAGMRVRNWKS